MAINNLNKSLNSTDALALVVGSMIGSGIFFAPALMAAWVQSPGVLIGLWCTAGLFTILGALVFSELSAMSPYAGGQYVFLRDAFGPFTAFLYGWMFFLVIQTGFNAAVAIAFAKYLGAIVPQLGEKTTISILSIRGLQLGCNSAQLVACVLLVALTWLNCRSMRQGATLQRILTALKLLALGLIIVVGFSRLPDNTGNFVPLFSRQLGDLGLRAGFLTAVAVAMSKALFAYDAWGTVTLLSEEVRNPQRTLPLALIAGCLCVTVLYVLINIAYLSVFPAGAMATLPEARVAEFVITTVWGRGGALLVVVAILFSAAGCLNGLLAGGARMLFAMARDKVFFRQCVYVDAESGVPAVAFWWQCGWSCVIALSGSYANLLTYTTFTSVFFSALTVASIFRLRWKYPKAARPYRCWGYPVTPALYLLCAVLFLTYVVLADPAAAVVGIAIMATGIPLYLFYFRSNYRQQDIPAAAQPINTGNEIRTGDSRYE